jgi:hypothetical protein
MQDLIHTAIIRHFLQERVEIIHQNIYQLRLLVQLHLIGRIRRKMFLNNIHIAGLLLEKFQKVNMVIEEVLLEQTQLHYIVDIHMMELMPFQYI